MGIAPETFLVGKCEALSRLLQGSCATSWALGNCWKVLGSWEARERLFRIFKLLLLRRVLQPSLCERLPRIDSSSPFNFIFGCVFLQVFLSYHGFRDSCQGVLVCRKLNEDCDLVPPKDMVVKVVFAVCWCAASCITCRSLRFILRIQR